MDTVVQWPPYPVLERSDSPLIYEDQRTVKCVKDAIEKHAILLKDEDVEMDDFDTHIGEVDVNGMDDSINIYNRDESIAGKQSYACSCCYMWCK
ncbi:hypothetical protein V6N11_009880 [Hibiscus sabdariffa]|uniref:Uncharacterized protein n=1 Tax=Hibiscus sabdariffa TaxID=183260 RepID=A0ABR1ZEM1_9ROSI